MHSFIRYFLLPICCLFLSLPLMAATASASGSNKADLFFGYSRLGSNAFSSNTGALNGWEASLHVKTYPFIGFEGNLSHYGIGAAPAAPHPTIFLFGPRVTLGTPVFQLYGHFLGGGAHADSSNTPKGSAGALTYALGGGVDFQAVPFLSWRFAADYLGVSGTKPTDSRPVRFSLGAAFRF
jgi:hypothetical protein